MTSTSTIWPRHTEVEHRVTNLKLDLAQESSEPDRGAGPERVRRWERAQPETNRCESWSDVLLRLHACGTCAETFNDLGHLRVEAAPVTEQEAVNADPT